MDQKTNGGSWQLLGSFMLAPGQSHRVEMTDVTPDGTYIIADAVRLVPKANVAKAASWEISVGSTGSYKVYAKWPASSAHATDAQYTVTHAGGSTTATANQRTNGGKWNLLGAFTFNAGTTYKVLTNRGQHQWEIAVGIGIIAYPRTEPDGPDQGSGSHLGE